MTNSTNKKTSDLSDAELSELVAIHRGLSPENLSCDGECSQAEVRVRKSALLAKLKEFKTKHGMSEQEIDEGVVFQEWIRRRP